MQFEAKLPAGIAAWVLGQARLDSEAFIGLSMARYEKKPPSFPATVQSRYLNLDESIPAAITVFGFGEIERIDRWRDPEGKIVIKRGAKPKIPTHVRIEIADEAAGKAIQKVLDHYSLENDGEGIHWRDHCVLYERIDAALKPEGLSVWRLEQTAPLTRPAIEALMNLGEKVERFQWRDIHHLFGGNAVPKKERALVVSWLLKRFETDPKTDDQLGMRIWDNAVPEIAEDLIRLIEDRRYDRRGPLCEALAKTKHPRAADVIASVMNEKWMTQFCLDALGKTRGAEKHIPKIQVFLRDADSDVRRAAKKLLKKLGAPVEVPPAPVHLVKGKGKLPRGLEEWSANLDMDGLAPTLKKLAARVQEGFGESEIAETVAVAEEMEPEQTKTLRFPVSAEGNRSEVWVSIFMDDVNSPDLYIYADPRMLKGF